MEVHLESRFHKEHFKFLSSQLSKPTTDFLQVTEPLFPFLDLFIKKKKDFMQNLKQILVPFDCGLTVTILKSLSLSIRK